MSSKEVTYLKSQGHVLKLSNLDKVLYPETGFTKREVLRYYRAISPVLLPHLKGRPISLKRFPNGTGADHVNEAFFEKNCPMHRPKWMKTVHFGKNSFCLIEDVSSLLYLANLASLEFHVSLASLPDLESPDSMVMDLDPGPGIDFKDCIELGFVVRKELARSGLECFAKSSGKKGLHLYVPLNRPTSYDVTKEFARSLAMRLEKQHDFVISRMAKKDREGKILIDWSQNVWSKTTVAPYSLRSLEKPSVSLPVTWDELEKARKKKALRDELLAMHPDLALKRIQKLGDLFLPVLKMKQTLSESRMAA